MTRGRYPFKSGWGFRGKISACRTQVRNPTNDGKVMWLDFFFGDDGIIQDRFGIFKRWTGKLWVNCTNFRVRWF
jgi:hypothetical protein